LNPLHQSSPDELTSLQMENNLLIHEVRLLRAQLTAAQRWRKNREQADRDEGSTPEQKQAFQDIRHLVDRLNGSSLGPVLRRRPGFRELVERYGRRDG
jgi:hypothetical protein